MSRILTKACRSVPEGRTDRSLAEVPGTGLPRKVRPVGYGMIRVGVCTDSTIGVTNVL